MARRPRKPVEGEHLPRESALVPWRPRRLPGEPGRVSGQEPPPERQRQLEKVWGQLRGQWSWLVVVPADTAYSTVGLAQALCQVGSRLSIHPVGFVEATDIDLDRASQLIGQLGTSNSSSDSWTPPTQNFASSSWGPPITKAIVALESPLANPLALPVALAADGVVLCVRRGRSKLAEVRHTIDAVGADRIVCCVLVD